MKKTKIAFFLILAAATLTVSCVTKGEPSNRGELLTIEQIKALKNDNSMNGKLVTIEGYAGFCNYTTMVRKGTKNKLTIYSDGICEGEKLINVEIKVSKGETLILGKAPRNFADFSDDKNLTNESMTFMTDDFQEVKNEKLKFSGTIVYDEERYYLDNVTIHK